MERLIIRLLWTLLLKCRIKRKSSYLGSVGDARTCRRRSGVFRVPRQRHYASVVRVHSITPHHIALYQHMCVRLPIAYDKLYSLRKHSLHNFRHRISAVLRTNGAVQGCYDSRKPTAGQYSRKTTCIAIVDEGACSRAAADGIECGLRRHVGSHEGSGASQRGHNARLRITSAVERRGKITRAHLEVASHVVVLHLVAARHVKQVWAVRERR